MQQLFDGFDVLQLSDRINTDSAAFWWMIWISGGFFYGWHGKSFLAKLSNIRTKTLQVVNGYFADYSLIIGYVIDIIWYWRNIDLPTFLPFVGKLDWDVGNADFTGRIFQ
jgi:hypothetical protein